MKKYWFWLIEQSEPNRGWWTRHELSSAQVYKIVKPKELRGLFLTYHTMDPAQAIERILEAKGMLTDENKLYEKQK